MRIYTNGIVPDVIDVNVRNATGTLMTAGTVVYFNVDGLTITTVANANQAGTLLTNVLPNGGIGYARKMGPYAGTYIALSGGGGGGGSSIQLTPSTEPTANIANQGKIILVAGGVGVADTLRICVKDSDDVYLWVSLF